MSSVMSLAAPTLAQWLRNAQANGLTQEQIRDSLRRQGYQSQEIDRLLRGDEKDADSSSAGASTSWDMFKESLRPTGLRIALVSVFGLFMLVAFVVNSIYIPSLADTMCTVGSSAMEISAIDRQIKDKLNVDTTAPNEIVQLLERLEARQVTMRAKTQQSFANHVVPLFVGNMYTFGPLLLIDPSLFLPLPCEANVLGLISGNTCRYYASLENQRCFETIHEAQSFSLIALSGFFNEVPPFQKIQFVSYLIHMVFTLCFLYLFGSLLVFFVRRFSGQKPVARGLIIVGLLSFFFLPANFAFHLGFLQTYLISILPIIIGSLLYASRASRHKLTLICGYGFIVLLFLGLPLAGFLVTENLTTSSTPEKSMQWTHPVISCIAPIAANATQSTVPIIDEEEGLSPLCEQRSCDTVCESECSSTVTINAVVLRSSTPACICSCFFNARNS